MEPITSAALVFFLIFTSIPGKSRTSKDPEPQAFIQENKDADQLDNNQP